METMRSSVQSMLAPLISFVISSKKCEFPFSDKLLADYKHFLMMHFLPSEPTLTQRTFRAREFFNLKLNMKNPIHKKFHTWNQSC